MSTDDVAFPKSAFAPFSNGSYPSSGDVITSRPFAYVHPSQDQISRPDGWYQTNGLPGPSPLPHPRCFGQIKPSMAAFETGMDDNVANCVTVTNDDVSKNESSHLASQGLLDQNYSNPSTMQCMMSNCSAVSSHFNGQMPAPAPVMPLIIQSQIVKSDNLPPRQVYYHKRHHPPSKTTSTFDISASELKNKSRFSATGASGKSTVVRDCKMSLSSSPPSPCAGSAGGSLCSLISRSHFKPISAQCQLFSSRNSAATLPYSTTKKVSATSTSPTRPSISPSSRSSTSSSSGIASRKRRADEESSSQRCYRSSGYSSTSEVIAGVGHVRLCDRSSTGSVSPVEPAMRSTDWVSPQQPHKRSKNDNEEDDDVIFVSMEPGRPKPPSSSPSLKPFTGVSPKQAVKSSRKSKKESVKKPLAPAPATFSVPNSVFPLQALHQFSNAVPTNFVAPGVTTIATPSSLAAVPMNSVTSKGYFLRSSVSGRNSNKEEVANSKLSPHTQELNVPSAATNARYQTRSLQKRKVEKPQVRGQPAVQKYQEVAPLPNTASLPVTTPSTSVIIPVEKAIPHPPVSVETSERSRTILLNDSHRRTSSSAFNKIYEIKGKIGVGGGGVVYAG